MACILAQYRTQLPVAFPLEGKVAAQPTDEV